MSYQDDTGDISMPAILGSLDMNFTFTLGMTFESEDDAYNAYNAYGITKGFGVRRGNKSYNRKNELTSCYFLCSCEGKSEGLHPHEPRRRERMEYRCGCKALIRFKITDGIWKVSKFSEEHNHPMVKESERHFIASAKKFTGASKNILSKLVDSGVKAKSAYRYLANEVGGSAYLSFTERDCHNFIQSRKANLITAGDAQSLIDHFKKLNVEDPDFFHTFQLDEHGRLSNIFWRDGVSKLHYDCFGDVVIFDTTYRTNKYNMICAPFVGVNNHWKNIFFGCAFLSDEKIESFVWLFKSFLDSMGGKKPKTIFTDQDQAMAQAIALVLNGTRHRLCEWHIEKNATKNIPHLIAKSGFKTLFHKLLWSCENENEFETIWQHMTIEWNCKENQWLQRLYELRKKWCPVFNRDVFSANIKSTQRSEATNRVFNSMASKTMNLTEFVKHYENRAKEMRDMETSDDYANRGKVKPHIAGCAILDHGAEIYTRAVFYKFQLEFEQAMSEMLVGRRNDADNPTCQIFTVKRVDSSRIHDVSYDFEKGSIMCSCHLFETIGWFCSHALRVLHIDLQLSRIPSQYVLARWTKSARQALGFENYTGGKLDVSSCQLELTFTNVMRKSVAIVGNAYGDQTALQICSDHLDAMKTQYVLFSNSQYK